MTQEQRAHLDGMLNRFSAALAVKYVNGQKEHGGNVWMKPGMLREAKAEVLDLWVYLDTLEQQLAERVPDTATFVTGFQTPRADATGTP